MTDTQKITEHIFLPDSPDVRGDIAFVFGTWKAWHESVKNAADLYSRGFVSKVLFTGGINRDTGIVEGPMMAEEGIRLGIKPEDVLIEDTSLNTLENVVLGKKVLEAKIGLENITTIVLIVKNFHARRALMTMKKHMPAHIQYKIRSYVSNYGFTPDTWTETEAGRERVMAELERIKKYIAQGDIAEL